MNSLIFGYIIVLRMDLAGARTAAPNEELIGRRRCPGEKPPHQDEKIFTPFLY